MAEHLTPYKMIEAHYFISKIEKRSCNTLLNQPYLDELEDLYNSYFEKVNPLILQIERPVSIVQILKTMQYGRYYNKEIIIGCYLQMVVIYGFQLENLAQDSQALFTLSNILYPTAFFGAIDDIAVHSSFLKLYGKFSQALIDIVNKKSDGIQYLGDPNQLKMAFITYFRLEATLKEY